MALARQRPRLCEHCRSILPRNVVLSALLVHAILFKSVSQTWLGPKARKEAQQVKTPRGAVAKKGGNSMVKPRRKVFRESWAPDLAALDVAAERGDVAAAEALYDKLKTVQVRPHVRRMFVNTVIKACANCGDLQSAELWFGRLQSLGIKANCNGVGKLAEAAAKAGDYDRCCHWAEECKKLCRGDGWIRICMDAAAKSGRVDAMDGLRAYLDASGEQMDLPAFGAMLDASAKAGDPEAALNLLEEMETANLAPDLLSFTAVLEAFAKAGDVAGARGIFSRLKTAGLVPDIPVFGTMIAACARLSDMDAAENWLREAVNADLSPNLVMYNAIINGHANSGHMEKAEGLLEEVLAKGLVPDAVTYTGFITAHARQGDPEAAEHWFYAMVEKGVRPDRCAYEALLSAWAKKGNYRRVEEFLEHMTEAAFSPNVISYTTAMDACVKAKLPSRAEVWFRHLLQHQGNDLSAIPYSILINGYALQGDLGAAKNLLREMEERRLCPDSITYSSLVNVAGKAGDAAEASALFREMVSRGLKANVVTYTALVNAFARQGNVTGSIEVLLDMAKERIQPNTVTYSCVVKACGRAQELDRAFMFLRDMQEQRIAQNIMTWAPVIEAVCKHRDDAAVQDGLQRMLRAGVAPQGRAQQQLEERLGPLNLALACAEYGLQKKGRAVDISAFARQNRNAEATVGDTKQLQRRQDAPSLFRKRRGRIDPG